MAYKLPRDDDGVKYHGVVDRDDRNPGQFMYGLDEDGNKRIVRTDKDGNVLTQLTGSNIKRHNVDITSNFRLHNGAIEAGVTKEVINVTSPSVISLMSIRSTNKALRVYIYGKNRNGSDYRLEFPNINGFLNSYVSISLEGKSGSEIFEVIGENFIGLKKSLYFANGFKVELRNVSEETFNVSGLIKVDIME